MTAAKRTLLFDLDGTLADTAPDLIAALDGMLAERGLPSPPHERLRALVSDGARALLACGFGLESAQQVDEALRAEYLQRYSDLEHRNSSVFAGIKPLLAAVERRHWDWGIVTSKPQYLSESLLRRLSLWPACLICPDQVTHTKPHPEPVQRALEILAAEPETAIYVGDHRNDLQSGRAAGVAVVGCAWGYGLEAEDVRLCDFWAEEPADLRSWLLPAGNP